MSEEQRYLIACAVAAIILTFALRACLPGVV